MSFGDDMLAPKDKSEIDRDRYYARMKGFQKMTRNMAALIPVNAPGVYNFGHADFIHASGDVICNGCGLPYREHPIGMEISLILLCDGKQVKL